MRLKEVKAFYVRVQTVGTLVGSDAWEGSQLACGMLGCSDS